MALPALPFIIGGAAALGSGIVSGVAQELTEDFIKSQKRVLKKPLQRQIQEFEQKEQSFVESTIDKIDNLFF